MLPPKHAPWQVTPRVVLLASSRSKGSRGTRAIHSNASFYIRMHGCPPWDNLSAIVPLHDVQAEQPQGPGLLSFHRWTRVV